MVCPTVDCPDLIACIAKQSGINATHRPCAENAYFHCFPFYHVIIFGAFFPSYFHI
jgi:hypothetical protein